jgi:hypothetical protein
MKKAFIFLVAIALGFGQFDSSKLRAHFGIIFVNPTSFEFGADYKLANFDQNFSLYGNFNLAFGGDSETIQGIKTKTSLTLIEFGATTQAKLNDPKLKDLYFIGGLLISIASGSAEISGIDLPSSTNTEATIMLGAGYKFTPNFFSELAFGITGADGLRLRLGYNF